MILNRCPDCGTAAGQPHQEGCDVEHCSVCGEQRLSEIMDGAECKEHDPSFSRWTGFWPGSLESKELGIDLNTFYEQGLHRIVLVKPEVK